MLVLAIFLLTFYLVNRFILSAMKISFMPPQYNKFILLAAFVLSLFYLNPLVHNAAGERTYYQNPLFGGEGVIFDPGYHWVGPFARTHAWPDVMNTNFD